MTDTQIQSRKQHAILKNWPSVVVADENFGSNKRQLAGYLYLANTAELKTFLYDSDAGDLIGKFENARTNGFGVTS